MQPVKLLERLSEDRVWPREGRDLARDERANRATILGDRDAVSGGPSHCAEQPSFRRKLFVSQLSAAEKQTALNERKHQEMKEELERIQKVLVKPWLCGHNYYYMIYP